MMKMKLLKSVLVGNADVIPTKRGTIVDMQEDQAKEFVTAGLAEHDKPQKDEKAEKKGK